MKSLLEIVSAVGVSILLSILALKSIRWTGADLKDFKQRNRVDFLSIAALFNLMFIAGVGLLLHFWEHAPLHALGFRLHPKDLAFVLLVNVISAGVAVLFLRALHRADKVDFQWNPGTFSGWRGILSSSLGFLVLFIAALQEEVLFRGYCTFVLRPYGFWFCLIISNLTFTFWHFLTNKVSLLQTVDWVLGGVMLFLIYWWTESVWMAALIHFGRNMINVVLFNISGQNALFKFDHPIPPAQKSIFTAIYTLLIICLTASVYGA